MHHQRIPLGASVAPDAFHPAFQCDRVQTATMLRHTVQRYEDIFRELFVILDVPAGTPVDEVPALVEQCLRREGALVA